ncbi:MAG: AMP-binding protein [Eubacteriales bacterium]|nr:AMP-binding protein [Eubacteriales bacterium]
MNNQAISNKIFSYAKTEPGRPAVLKSDGKGASYGDFAVVYRAFSDFIAMHDIQGHERIAILSDNGLATSLLALPIMECNVLVTVDRDLAGKRLIDYITLLSTDYLLTDKSDPELASLIRDSGFGLVHFDLSGDMGQISCSFELVHSATVRYGDIGYRTDDLANLSTTSGTTSTPKIVPTTTLNHLCGIESTVQSFGYNENDKMLIVTKMSKLTSINAMLAILSTGGCVMITNVFNHNEFVNMIKSKGITLFTASPAVLNSLADYLKYNQIDLGITSLRFVRSSGAPLPGKLKGYLEDAFKTSVIQTYGMTETKLIATTYGAPKGYKEGSVGISAGSLVSVVDGEILIKGPCVFSGYENLPEVNALCFTDGWFHTGDMGYVDEDGYIFITGRIKEMINRGGEKVSPYEVESFLLGHEDIKSVAVFPYPNRYGSEDVGAVVVPKESKTTDLNTLRRYLTGKVPHFKMPSLLYVVDEIPVGQNGKIQRKQLFGLLSSRYPDKAPHTVSDRSAGVPPFNGLTETQRFLIGSWQNILNRKNIGLSDNFFEAGGDSLAAAALFSEIENQYGIQVPVNVFFNNSTVAELSDYIDHYESVVGNFKFLFPIKASGYKNPLICVHSGDGEAVTYHHLAQFMEESRPVYGLRFDPNAEGWFHPLSFDQICERYVDEIVSLDPIGPYNLCGTCYGGVLAFKIAVGLKQRGYVVGILAMFDSVYATGKKRKLSRQFVNSLGELKDHRVTHIPGLVVKKTATMMSLLRNKGLKKRYVASLQGNQSQLTGRSAIEGPLAYAYGMYRPEYYNGRIHYFKSVKDKIQNLQAVDFWKGNASDFEFIEMPCRHTEINDSQNSKFLAHKLSALMED